MCILFSKGYWRVILAAKLEGLRTERDLWKRHKTVYPINTLGYEKIILTLAVLDVKIAIWEALL